ncbi:MAG: hypothetical protein IT422_11965 [Pirellulaceae bacterium]|nr:hypothetical protein [Pirellulaceae bacterium]
MNTKYFMGVDEAGYGPNLGPLVVAASLWKTPEDCSEQQFSHAMAKHFSTANWSPSCHHVPLGDSKKLYATRSGLATLEAGLLALQFSLAPDCTSLGQFIQRVVRPESIDELNSLDWYAGYAAEPIPSVLELTEVLRLSQLAQSNLAPVGIELVDLKATIVCEPHFNQAVAKSGSKGELLSRTTLELVVQLLEQCPSATEVFCDRQGGRKNYLPNLLAAMPDEWFNEVQVSPARSSYQSCGARPLTIHFSVGGDSFPPTALASMLAKYLRERLMHPLNAFWQGQLPQLKPTAGYPVDAQRFRAAIEPVAERLKLSIDQWWRCK